MPKSHVQNSHASATPACDGERLFSVFIHDRGLWITATDLNGKILWQTKAGDYDAIYGYGSSPAIWQSLVIVLGDNDQTGAFLAAVHRKTGQLVWRIAQRTSTRMPRQSLPMWRGEINSWLAAADF